MREDKLKEFTVRISQANRGELLVVVYDIILEDMNEAVESFESGEMYSFVQSLRHGQKFLLELMDTLDVKYDISKNLMSLYIYVNREIINSMIRRDVTGVHNAIMVMEKLRDSYSKLAKDDNSPPLMVNTQQVYAGLTYGKGMLNETAIDGGNRGFKA